MTYAILVGRSVFGDVPDPMTLVGAAVITARGLQWLVPRQAPADCGHHP
jgi:hypothetical protein